MTFLKRHVINIFAFAFTGKTENGDACIFWRDHNDLSRVAERMVLNADGTFNRLERPSGKGWKLAKLQGNPKCHNELLETVKRLGWDINTIWRRPIGRPGTPEWAEEA